MSYIVNWSLFLEAIRNPEDLVDLFKITCLVEQDKPFNAYSVMKGKNENTCINFHISQIINRIKTGKITEISSEFDLESDELYFYQYVIDWLIKTGSQSLSEDVISQNFRVEKINRKKNLESGEFENEYTNEKISRLDANELKRIELRSDKNAFRAKVPFSGESTLIMRNPPKPKISETEIWQKQRKEKKFLLRSEGTKMLFDFFDRRFVDFFEPDVEKGEKVDQVAYWSAIYTELVDILRNGRWIWEISGEKQVITEKENRDYKLGLKINPPEAARQLTEIEFDSVARETDKINGWGEYGESLYKHPIRVYLEKKLEGREIEIMADGSVRIPVIDTSDDADTHRIIFTDTNTGSQIKIANIRKTNLRDGYFISYIGREREVVSRKTIHSILAFVDSNKNKTTLPELGFSLKKEPRFPFRSIPIEKKELYDVLFRNYDTWRIKKNLPPYIRTTTTTTSTTTTKPQSNDELD